MKLTIYEMAEKAGVSIATISRALNAATRSKVSPQTLEKIDALIARHGYTPSLAAKNLSRASYNTIGVLFPHHEGIFFEDYYAKVLCGTADALLDSNYHLKIVMLKCEKPRWDRHNFKSAEGVDGLIVTHWHAFFSERKVLERLGVPVVIISDPEKEVRAHFVSGNHVQGGGLAAEHLWTLGHRKIGLITGSPDSRDSADRIKGFTEFLKSKNLKPAFEACGHFQEEKAAELVPDLLRTHPGVTAYCCLNDGMAIGVMRALGRAGRKVPADISVMGYDNERRGEQQEPPLTTIEVPVYDLARAAGRRLVEYLHAGSKQSKEDFFTGRQVFPVRLVERKSAQKK